MSGNVVSELVLKFTGDTSNAMSALGALDGKVAASAKNYIDAMGKMDNSLAKMVSAHPAAVAGAVALGAGLVYAGAKAIEAAASYDASSTALSNSAQISKSAADTIGTSFLKTAGDSTFSAQQIMSAYAPVAGMLGNVEGHALTNADAMKVMTASQELAEATGADLGKTTSNVAQIMKDYHLNTDQAGQASNDLYNLQRLTGNSTDSLVVAFNRLQPVIAGSNISVDQSSGLMLEMTTAFGSGRKAIGLVGTTLQAMTEPTTIAKKALDGVGISLTDANGKFIGLGPALDAFKGYMDSGATATQKNALMQAVFGKNADDMKKIVEGGSAALDSNTKAISGNNAVSKAAAAAAGTLEGQQKTLKAAFSDMAVVLGQVLIPIVMNLMSAMMTVLTPIAAWVTQNKLFATIIGGVIAGVVGLTVAVIAITAVVGALTTVFGILTGEVIFLNMVILPVWAALLIVVAAIAAVIAVVVVLIKYWGDVVQAFKDVVGWVVQAVDWFTTLSAPLKILIGTLVMMVAPFMVIIGALILLYQNWDTVWRGMTDVWNTFYAVTIGQIIHAWDLINWAAVWGVIESTTSTVWDTLKAAWNSFYTAVVEPIIHAWDAVDWGAVWDSILSATETVWSAITAGWASFVGGLITVWAAVSTPFVAAWNTVWATLKKPLADLADAFSGLGASFTSIWASGISPAISTLKKSWDSVWGSMKGAISGLGDAFSGVGSTLTSIWSSGVYPAITSIKKAWDSIWGSLKDAVSNVGKSFSGIGSTITGVWSQSLRPALDSIGKAFSGLGKTASDLWNKDIKPAFEEIGKAISSLWSSGSPAKKATEGATTGVHALGTESHDSGITIKTAFDAILDVVKFVLQSIAVAITIVADVIKVFAVVIGWLANEIFAPMFRIIASVVSVAVQAIVVGIDIVSVVIKIVATVVSWLAQNIFVPMFKLIADTVSVAAVLISAAIDVITVVIRAVAVVVSWLAQNIVEPMIKLVTDAFQVAATIISGIVDAIGVTIRAMAAVFSTVLSAIQNNILQVWGAISTATTTTWNAIVVLVEGIWNTLKNDAITLFTAIQNAIQVVWNTISTAASVMWNAISTAIQVIWNALKLAATTIFTAIQNAIQAVWNTISTAAGTMWNSISNNVIQPVWNALKATAGTVFTGIQNVIQGVWDSINTAAKTMWDAIVTTISTAWNGVKKAVADPINVVITIGNAFINGANKVLGIVGVPAIPDIPGPVKFATGGTVPGGWGGGDTVPAMLTPGERVLSTHQVKQMGGHNNIDNMLGMAHGGAVPVQYFADGGVVLSGGMSNGSFHGSWKDNVNGVTYTDIPGKPGTQVSAADLTAYVNGTNSPAKSGPSLGGLVSTAAAVGNAALGAAKTVASVPGLVTSALVGLGKDFVFGALAAAANLALAPLKAAVGALPDKPLGAGLAKGGAHKILDGVYNFIAHKDKELGHAPVAVGGSGTTGSVSVAQEAAALAYAVAHFMGLPYTWGNNDCSGIVQKSYAAQGVSLPRVSSTQYGASVAVSEASAVPGDLAFYNPGTSGAPAGLPGHVGFYAGAGKIFDAYNTSRPIGYDPLSLPGNTFMGIRRPGGVAGSGGPAPAGTGAGQALTAQQWAVDFLGMMGAPASPGMVDFIWEWEAAEGGTWRNSEQHNPLNIAAFDSNPNNSQSNFATWAAGLSAAVRVLNQSNMSGLRAGIMSGNPAAALAALVASPWASSHYNGGASFPKSPGSYGSVPHLAEGGIVGYSVGGVASGLIKVGENGPELIDLGNRDSYVHRNGSGPDGGIDYDKLAAAMANNQNGVTIQNMNVGSTAQAEDVIHELSWHLRTVKMV